MEIGLGGLVTLGLTSRRVGIATVLIRSGFWENGENTDSKTPQEVAKKYMVLPCHCVYKYSIENLKLNLMSHV